MLGKQIGQAVRDIRLKKNLTQDQVAERAGMNTTHVGHIEQGFRTPRFETLKKLADALHVRVKDLIPF